MAYSPKYIKKRKRKLGWLFDLAAVVFLLLLLAGSAMYLGNRVQSKKDQDAFRELAALVEAQTAPADVREFPEESDASQEETPEETQSPATPYQILYEKNPDFAGWLTVPETRIDYPVMHTPGDIEHYLYRAFDGSDSPSGTPFVGDYGDLNSRKCIIYGHNMADGTMFHDLLKYLDKDFWQANPIFTITTLTEKREYEIFAAVQTRILYQEEHGLRFYRLEEGVEEWMRKRSLYDTAVVPKENDDIVILSTCSYHTEEGRFIIAGRRIQ